jgi:hypothetical protein
VESRRKPSVEKRRKPRQHRRSSSDLFAAERKRAAVRRLRTSSVLAGFAVGTILTASAPPIAAQQVTEQQSLAFGRIAEGQTSGTVTVTPTGTASCGPLTCLGGQHEASFQVIGLSLRTYGLSYSTGNTLNRTGGGSLPLQNFKDNKNGTLTLNLLGVGTFRVGGDLSVSPTAPGGDYSGTYTIIFNLE